MFLLVRVHYRLHSDGKVGIGTSSPITKLDTSQDNIGGNVALGIFQSGAGAVKFDNVLQISNGTDWQAIKLVGNDGSTSAKAFDDLVEVAGLHSSDTGLWTTVQGYVSGGLQYNISGASDFTYTGGTRTLNVNKVIANEIVYNTSLSGAGNDTGSYGRVETDALSINSAIEFPVSDGTPNQVLKTDGNGNLDFAAFADVLGNDNITTTGTITHWYQNVCWY